MNTVRWFSTAAGIAFGATFGALATAAPVDLVYETGGNAVSITGAQAANIADEFITASVWTGDRADILRVCAWRVSPGVFKASAVGLATSAPGSLPVSAGAVQVVGIVE